MNTRWLKHNWLLLTFVVSFIVVFGLVGWQLWGQYGAYQQTQTTLAEKQGQLDQLQNNDPTPTEANLEVVNTNLKRLQAIQKELQLLVLRDAMFSSAASSNNIEFTQHLRKTVEALEDRVEAAKIAIPKDFKFGFKRYATSVPKPDPQLLERLSKQVAVIQKLTTLMIESGVEEIDAIRRVEIEPGVPADDALSDVVLVQSPEHYVAMPFELRFVCDAKPLQTLLNKIATADVFLVVRLVTLEQEALLKRTDPMMGGLPPMRESLLPPPRFLPGVPATGADSVPTTAEPTRPPRLRVQVRLDFIEVLPSKRPARGTP